YATNNERGFPVLSAAPEVLQSWGRVHNIKSDVWSFGVLMWEVFTLGSIPSPGLDLAGHERENLRRMLQRLRSGARLHRPDHASEELYAVMQACWRPTPETRPEFKELRQRISVVHSVRS